MSGGVQKLIFNLRERLVSNDHDRLQDFIAKHDNNITRRLLCTRPNNASAQALESGSFLATDAADNAPIGTPLNADVFEGLVVFPENGSLRLLVSPGVVGLDDPDGQSGSSESSPASPDDSRYKVVVDAGIQAFGVISMTAGSGGATRIDLIECQRKTVTTEQQNRDVYNVTTGLFTGTLVDKVHDDQLTYRVRQGTPGAGIPAFALGWLPICVASVPSTATNNDTITFWDVRPLVKDRVNAPFESFHVSPTNHCRIYGNEHTDPTKLILTGIATSSLGMYQCGGLLPNGAQAIDARAVANHASGYAPSANRPWFLYAVFPGGLPRWVRYLPSPSFRIPSGPLGVIVISEIGPATDFGIGITGNPPVATGLISSGPKALLASGVVDGAVVERGIIANDGMTYLNSNAVLALPAPAASSTTDTYTLTANAHFPNGAKAVLVKFAATFTGTIGTVEIVHKDVNVISTTSADRLAVVMQETDTVVYTSTTINSTFTVEVPVVPFGVLNSESDGILVVAVNWGTTNTRSLTGASVIGWRL